MNRLASTTRGAVEAARQFARSPAVIQATGLGRSTICRLVASGAFPRPLHLGPRDRLALVRPRTVERHARRRPSLTAGTG
jgi:predicted DNA-binding transcriptional regulator AlpA